MAARRALIADLIPVPEGAMLKAVDEKPLLPVTVAKGGIGASTPGVAYDPIPEKRKLTGLTSIGLGPSQGDNLVLFSLLFFIESRYSLRLGIPLMPDAAGMGFELAGAFLLPSVAEPEAIVRMAELVGARLAIELVGDQVGAENLFCLLAKARLGLLSDCLTTRGLSV